MKNIIAYFSATGNSLFIAKKIAEKFDAELIPIKNIKEKFIVEKCEYFGIISPVYAVGLPEIVEKFIKNLSIKNSSYNFLLINHAGGPLGTAQNAFNFFKKHTNQTLNAVFDLKMPANDIALFGTTPPQKIEPIINQALVQLEKITEKIAQKQELKPKIKPISAPLSKIIHNIFEHETKKAGKRFIVTDKCVSCGICQKICPTNNIELKNGKPVWESNCIVCEACINWCPKHAIEKGRLSKNRQQYTNPYIKKEELF